MGLAIIAALISSAHGSVARTCSPQPACSSGVRDTAYCENINSSSVCAATSSCASYNEGYPSQKSNVALLAFAMTMAVGMCFCIGGNDSANSWGSTVGSGALGIRSAVVLGGFAEWLGATLLGYGVSGTIRKGVADTDDPECWACGYCDSAMPVYQLGMLAALIGATFFLLLATFAKVPVSTTHAIVGGVVGMTMVGAKGGAGCLNWKWKGGLTSIIASWVISPVLSGGMPSWGSNPRLADARSICYSCIRAPIHIGTAIGAGVYAATSRLTTRSRSPLRHALRLLPVLYSLSTTVMVLLILMKSKPTKHLDKATQARVAPPPPRRHATGPGRQ
jgi:sodium-dependent phosphate transporter